MRYKAICLLLCLLVCIGIASADNLHFADEFPEFPNLEMICEPSDLALIDTAKKAYARSGYHVRLRVIGQLVEQLNAETAWVSYNDLLLDDLTQLLIQYPDSTGIIHLKSNSLSNKASHIGKIGQLTTARELYTEAMTLQQQIGDTLGLANCLNNLGTLSAQHGDTKNAILYFSKSKATYLLVNNLKGVSASLNNLGYIYKKTGMIKLALDVLNESLILREKMGNKQGVATSLSNIASILFAQGEKEEALEHYTRALILREESGEIDKVGILLNNIGLIHMSFNSFEEANSHFIEAYATDSIRQNPKGMAFSLHNLALLHVKINELQLAEVYFLRSLSIRRKIHVAKPLCVSYADIATMYQTQGKSEQALLYADSSMQIAQRIGYPTHIKTAAKLLSELYRDENIFQRAYEMQVLYQDMSDSLNDISGRHAVMQFEVQYQTAKTHLSDSISFAHVHEKDLFKLKEQQSLNELQQVWIYMYLMIAFVVAISTIVIFRKYKKGLHQQRLIELQNEKLDIKSSLLELKNKEINDSINYAERIQHGLMTSQDYWSELFSEHYILFKPKSIVSGDFYWAFKTPDNEIIWIVADCTGHGVAGAFMSIIGTSLLNEIIVEKGFIKCDKILNELRTGVIKILKGRDGVITENVGMDLTICRLSPDLKVEYSGARNPLYVVRNGEVQVLSTSKQPIGPYPRSSPFQSWTLQLEKNDMLYMSTDGFLDQFGGKRNKKFKKKGFIDMIAKLSAWSTSQQHKEINQILSDWIGERKQIDDICIVAVRI